MLTDLSPPREQKRFQRFKKKKKWEKETVGQRTGVKDFSAGCHQWHGVTNLDMQGQEATAEVI